MFLLQTVRTWLTIISLYAQIRRWSSKRGWIKKRRLERDAKNDGFIELYQDCEQDKMGGMNPVLNVIAGEVLQCIKQVKNKTGYMQSIYLLKSLDG